MLNPQLPERHFPSYFARPSRLADKMAKLRHKSADIAYYIYRANDANNWLVFIHGNGEDHELWGIYIDRVLERGVNVLALDSRGQGKSSLGTKRLTYELMAEDVLAVMDEAGVDAAHIIGFSDGAIEALILGYMTPKRVKSILSIGANITPEGLTEEDRVWLQSEIAVREKWLLAFDDPDFLVDRDLELIWPSQEETKQQLALFTLMREEPHIQIEDLKKIKAPTTVMAGEFDSIVEAETKLIADSISNSKLTIIKEAGHNLPKHEIEAVWDAIVELLES